MTPSSLVPRVAIAGIGGFGNSHHHAFQALEELGRVRVTATCDPALDRLGDACTQLRFAERGVQTYLSFDDMLAAQEGRLDVGVVATPHQFHADMHKEFVRHKIACYLEKPPTLDLEEFQRMLDVEKQAARATNVGFRFVHDASRIALKRRIMSGEFGALRRIAFLGLSRRAPAYFQRNGWAGRLMIGGKLLLDSCLGNAMAHFINSLLFFAGGDGLHHWARPQEMSSELYRANPIEGTDTIFASGRLEGGVDFRFAATHACEDAEAITEEILAFDNAVMTIRDIDSVTIEVPGSAAGSFSLARPTLLDSVRDYLEFYEGRLPRPAQTLADSLGFVETNALFYLAAGGKIHSVPSAACLRDPETGALGIPGIAGAAREFIEGSVFPSQSGRHAWSHRGGSADVSQLGRLPQVVRELKGEARKL